MKKHLLLSLIGSLFIIGGASAITREKTDINLHPISGKAEIKGEIKVNGRTFKIGDPKSEKNKIKTRDVETTPVIENAPGNEQLYCKDVVGYGLGSPIQGYGVASAINWDGDDVYFLNVITAAPMGSYVKASNEGGEIILPMNQTVLTFEDEEYDLNLGLLRPILTVVEDSDGEESIYIWFEYSDDYDFVSYSVESNGTLILQSHEAKYNIEGIDPADYGFPYYVIGYYYTDDYTWSGYCDVFQAYDEFNYEKVYVPENLSYETFTYINSEEMGVIVSVAETDDSLYIKGLSAYAPDAVFKADIIDNGNKISVVPNQFIGIEADIYYIITSTCFLDKDGQLDVATDDTPVYFNLERDENGKILSITSDGSEYFLAFNDDPFYFYPLDLFMDLELTSKDEFYGIPATPQDVYYEDYSSMLGANYIFFKLSSFAYNGDIIDINNLFYSIYINGEPVEFEQQDGLNLLDEPVVMYRGINEPTYLVPYTFANDVDLYEDMGGTFIVGLYSEGIDDVGVQAVYTYGDTTTLSGLVTVDTITGEVTTTPGTETKVEKINLDDVKGVEYYDLGGRKISNPAKGLFIKKYTMSDGSIKSVKTILR